MKATTIALICLASLIATTSCKRQPAQQNYSVQEVKEPLSNDEVERAFYALGLTIERFSLMLPKETHVHYSLTKFVKGQPPEDRGSATGILGQGIHRTMLFHRKNDDGSVDFHVGCGVFDSGDMTGYGFRTWKAFSIKKLTKTKQPIYAYVAKSSTGGMNYYADLETLIDQFDCVIVVYMSLADDETTN